MSCCAGDAWGIAAGELVGIGIPGVCICGEAAGVGDAVGICIPGVIKCGLGEGEGLGLVVLLVAVRLRVTVLFFFGAAFGFALVAGLGITCPSCCGSTLMVSAKVKASAATVRSTNFKFLSRFMVPPTWFCQSELWQFLDEYINE